MTNPAKQKILLAEDEVALAQILSQKLTEAGFDVKIVYDGAEALKAMNQKTFDLLLLDLIMPRIDGFQVLEQMRKEKIKTSVIVMSNLSQTESETKALTLGAKDFIVKSDLSLDTIIKRVASFL
jgi:DNA-binding response OmpR family regulator